MPTRFPSIPRTELEKFIGIVRRLRRECPWDREQTHRSLRDSLIEEAYEVAETLKDNDLEELKQELGDLLLHVVMHVTIAEQAKEFTLKEVLEAISAKLIRRHPHVFGTTAVRDAAEVKHNWEVLKMQEGRSSVLDGVPKGMPALQRALQLQKRAAKVGFDWKKGEEVWQKVREELDELRETVRTDSPEKREEEFGDLLFALVNYARFIDVNPEDALHRSSQKFTARFRYVEQNLGTRGKSLHDSTLEEMDELWNKAKRDQG